MDLNSTLSGRDLSGLGALAQRIFGNNSHFPFENSSAASKTEEEDLEVNTDVYSKVIVTVIYVALFAVGSLGNSITLYTLLTKKTLQNLQSTVHYHLASLAVSDLLILVLSMPIELYNFIWFHHPWVFGNAVCRGYYFLRDSCSYATALNIASLSVERYMAICHPFKAKSIMSRSRTKKLISAMWLASFALATPMLFIMGQVMRKGEKICTAIVSPITMKTVLQEWDDRLLESSPEVSKHPIEDVNRLEKSHVQVGHCVDACGASGSQLCLEEKGNAITQEAHDKNMKQIARQDYSSSIQPLFQKRGSSMFERHHKPTLKKGHTKRAFVGFGAVIYKTMTWNSTSPQSTTRTASDARHLLHLVNAFLSFVVPMVAISALNGVIANQLLRMFREAEQDNRVCIIGGNPTMLNVTVEPNRAQSLRHGVLVLRAVVIAFVVCWLPYHARRLMFCYVSDWSDDLYDFYHYFYMLTNVLFYVSSAINPILYNLVSATYRQIFFSTLRYFCMPCHHTPRSHGPEKGLTRTQPKTFAAEFLNPRFGREGLDRLREETATGSVKERRTEGPSKK
eukprot:superscaffoldBa00000906_g7922